MIVDLKDTEGLTVRPITNIAGTPNSTRWCSRTCCRRRRPRRRGAGMGWQQVTSELGYERSGPERFLSAFRVFVERWCGRSGPSADDHQAAVLGRMAAHMMTLRRMRSPWRMLQDGRNPVVEAALVKDLGNNSRRNCPRSPGWWLRPPPRGCCRRTLEDTLLHAPAFTIRGGTREMPSRDDRPRSRTALRSVAMTDAVSEEAGMAAGRGGPDPARTVQRGVGRCGRVRNLAGRSRTTLEEAGSPRASVPERLGGAGLPLRRGWRCCDWRAVVRCRCRSRRP
ncbi:MAG: hypothetical protein U5R48_15145 [Gammaproteobacteria bacterium]|nr:hypothetical protein [Gammaproteobacteria bacterium]